MVLQHLIGAFSYLHGIAHAEGLQIIAVQVGGIEHASRIIAAFHQEALVATTEVQPHLEVLGRMVDGVPLVQLPALTLLPLCNCPIILSYSYVSF